jgi:hypothetical protein
MPADTDSPDRDKALSLRPAVDESSGSQIETSECAFFTFEVEMTLQASWVYRRAEGAHSRSSVIQDGQSAGLSLLSEITLSRISNISIIGLPISIADLICNQYYMPEPGLSPAGTGTHPAAIEASQLSDMTVHRSSSHQRNPTEETCAVCTFSLDHRLQDERVLTLPCGHATHEPCLRRVLAAFLKTCPSCDTELPDLGERSRQQ